MQNKWNRKISGFDAGWMLSILLLVFLMACESNAVEDVTISDSSPVVKINSKVITVGDFKKQIKELRKKFHLHNKETSLEEKYVLKLQAMNELVKNELFSREIANAGLSVTSDELKQEIHEAINGFSEKAFADYMELTGRSLKEWENNFKFNLLTNKLILLRVNSKVMVDDEQLHSYFESHADEFATKEQVRALHIMVKTEKEAREIQDKLKSKKNKFADLVRDYSVAPEGAYGGDLGYFSVGQMLEEFDSVFKLKEGQTSEIIKTPYGYHLFKVVDKKEGRKMTFEESRTMISNRLLQEKQDAAFNKWLNELKGQAKIQIIHETFAQIS